MKKNIRVGLYFFCHKRNMWAVYQYDTVNTETGYTSAKHIEDFGKYEDAVKQVYSLNGWKQPEAITRRF